MTSDGTIAAYDRIAALYAKRNAAMPEDLAAMATRFLELVRPDTEILDAGCGAGRDMAWMEAWGAQIIGIDLSAGMLAETRQRVHGPSSRWICARSVSPTVTSAVSGVKRAAGCLRHSVGQDCAMFAGGPFLGCAGGPLP